MLAFESTGVTIVYGDNGAGKSGYARILKRAQLVYAPTPDSTFELLRSGQADAFASIRGALLEYSVKLAGSRLLD